MKGKPTFTYNLFGMKRTRWQYVLDLPKLTPADIKKLEDANRALQQK